MMKKNQASASKEKKPYSEVKMIKRTFKVDSTKKSNVVIKSESKKKKVSTEDRFYNSFNHRNGFQSADNGKFKRKSNAKIISPRKEFTIDSKKLDQTVNEIWWKFVNYFNYEKTFNLKEVLGGVSKEEKNKFLDSKQNKEIDFDLKLQTIFNIYKIRKAPGSHNLISDSEEGSYILKHCKIWIIYIKNLIDKFNLKFKETHEIFNFALEYDSDEYLLFDFFILLAQEFEEEEIMEFNENTVPMRFIDIYIKNKDMILKTLKEDAKQKNAEKEVAEAKILYDLRVEEEFIDQNKNSEAQHGDESSLLGKQNNEYNNLMPLAGKSLNINRSIYEKDSTGISEILNPNYIEENENENDFSFNGKLSSQLSHSHINENPEIVEKSLDHTEDNLGTTNLDESSLQKDEDLNNESLNSYLVTNSHHNEDNYDFSNPILEESKENESMLSINNINDSRIEMSNNKSDVISINLITPLKTNLNNKEIITLTSIGKNRRNDRSLKKLIFGKDYSNDYDEAKLIEPNLRNSGNFAVLELLSKSQEKLGHKYVLTPLKKQIYCNKKEYDEAEKDLAEIHKIYPDFIYQPYDDELKAKIEKNI